MSDEINHLQWCKDRALPYCESGNLQEAFSSFMSDMGKSEETANHPILQMGMPLLMSGSLSTSHQMKEFINGFN